MSTSVKLASDVYAKLRFVVGATPGSSMSGLASDLLRDPVEELYERAVDNAVTAA